MVISKSAQKVLNKADKPTAMKLNKALNNIQNNAGYIEPLKQIQKGMEEIILNSIVEKMEEQHE